MRSARLAQAGGAVCGIAGAAVAGTVLGGRWWLPAALAATGAISGRVGALVQSVAVLTLVGGAAVEEVLWLVPLLVLGTFASVESSALPARINRVRPRVRVAPAGATAIAAALVSAAVLALAELGPSYAVPTALAACLASVALLASLRA